jgi:cytochrome c biogenesis protein CcdA
MFSIVVIASFGISLLVPQFQLFLEKLFSHLTSLVPNTQNNSGFVGGLAIGLSIGLLWTPCVGPILASVITLAITGTVTLDSFLITIAYSLGTALPMFLVMLGGQNILRRVPFLLSNLNNIQKLFGLLMVLTSIGLYFGIDRSLQACVINVFPNYSDIITKFENADLIKSLLR